MTMIRYATLIIGLLASCHGQFSTDFATAASSPSGFTSPNPTSPEIPTTTAPEGQENKPMTYLVTFSEKIRAGHQMNVQVEVFLTTAPVDIVITISNNDGDTVVNHGPIQVMAGAPKTITVDIPVDIMPDKTEYYYYDSRFEVEVTGKGTEMSFKKKGYVRLQNKAFSIFVQTDKAMYKPSQTVNFRTLAMTPDMKVMKYPQDIVIKDPKGNRIVQFKGVQAPENQGVVQKSFKLADSVPAGNWEIIVTIQGVEETKTFEVSDYVLPKFEAEIEAAPYGITTDFAYNFKVKAKYTFGKPVTEGIVYVSIKPKYGYIDDPRIIRKRGKLNKDGELEISVPLADLQKSLERPNSNYKPKLQYYFFEISANVTEERTQNMQNAKHDFIFYPTPIKIEFLGITPSSFKAGLNFTAYIEVKKPDGTLFSAAEAKDISLMINATYTAPTTVSVPKPVNNQINPLPSTAEKNGIPSESIAISDDRFAPRPRQNKVLKLKQHIYSLPDNGSIVINFTVPDEAEYINLEASSISSYSTEARAYKYVTKFVSPSKSFLQLIVLNDKAKVNDYLRVVANATVTIKQLNYQVFSKGALLLSDVVKSVNGPAKSIQFEFKLLPSMAPSLKLVAFFVEDSREIVVDALSLSVDGLFDNAVSLKFNKEKVQPGEEVDLVVKGQKDSVVFVLTVDKSVILLKSGNDITQDMVREELVGYDYGNFGYWRYMYVCGWPSYFGGSDAHSVFQNSGVVVLTDGLVYSRYDRDILSAPLPKAGPIMPGNTETSLTNTDSESTDKTPKLQPAKRTRKLFPENWLWKITTIAPDSDGEVVIPLTAPDTITSWVASVFSVNPSTGLSVAEKPAEVITFRNMFISLELPSSIIRNEHFCFLASVFSYYDGELPVMLTLEQSSDFSVIMAKEEDGTIIPNKEQLSFSYFLGYLKEDAVKSVTFCFTPEKLGLIPIRVSALTNVDGLSDAVERNILVKPEGVPRATSVPNLVALENGEWNMKLRMDFPQDTVQGSEHVSINIAGNLMGSVFDNLDDLLKKPYGCGEQNMINFAPIMSLLDFFFTTGTITDEFRNKAKEYMLIGYTKEILYEHGKTGGYSTFGNNENTKEDPSTWLTAFVTKCFSQAEQLNMQYEDVLAIDTDLILRSAKWMIQKQSKRGDFYEYGRVFNKNLQGGSAKGVALTSYTVISLHNAIQVLKQLTDSNTVKEVVKINRGVQSAVDYLEASLEGLTDPYDLCITTYALHLVDSSVKDDAFSMLVNMAKQGDGMVYWERPSTEIKREYYWWSNRADALNIEMTSYGLLTYSLRGLANTKGLPIVRWLSQQKGPNGGFISTQDTVIGIEALTTVAKQLFDVEFVPMTIEVTSGIDKATFQITKANEMTLQRKSIAYQAGGQIEVSANAPNGVNNSMSPVLVDVVFNYNVLSGTNPIVYDMKHTVILSPIGYQLVVDIWTANGEPASMTILEVELPTGYSSDLEMLKNHQHVSKADFKDGYLNVYIDTDVIGDLTITITVPIISNGGILMNAKGKSYRVYDYYEPEIELTKEYFLKEDGDFCSNVPELGLCQFRTLEKK